MKSIWTKVAPIVSAAAVVAVAAGFALVPLIKGVGIPWIWVGAGTAGWLVALMIRAPIALVSRRLSLSPSQVQTTMASASGPAEEIVLGHLGLDHAPGYGLKYSEGSKSTHMQRV